MKSSWILAVTLLAAPAVAADHAEAPIAGADPAADIADLYAWHDGGSIHAVLTFAPLTVAGGNATWDADVLYGIHIDNDDDFIADHDVWIRFGTDSGGAWGMQVLGLPGADPTVEGPVETEIDAIVGGASA